MGAEARFKVHADDIVLGLFSFAKLLMYRDLDPASWPAEMALDQRPLLRALLADGFRALPEAAPDEPPLDELLPPQDTLHVLDADASQAHRDQAARAGHSLLIQGPPGTGKSQTIANLIAAAVHDGKTVLFVAEKMAALEVVKRRLDQIGLGELCQELHSRHSNKRALLEELERTLRLGAPCQDDPSERFDELAAARARLNRHAAEPAPAARQRRRHAVRSDRPAGRAARAGRSAAADQAALRDPLAARRAARAARSGGGAGPPRGRARHARRALLARGRPRRAAAERSSGDRPGGRGAARAGGAVVQGRHQAAGVARHAAGRCRRSSGSSA